jgi:hypothetical protein
MTVDVVKWILGRNVKESPRKRNRFLDGFGK